MSLYNKILPAATKISDAMGNMPKTIASVIRMMLCSKIGVAIKSKAYRTLKGHSDCTILANGPSLKEAMEKGEVRLDGVDVFCVNGFFESEYFWKIQPGYYFLVDGEFFNPTLDRTKTLVANLVAALNKVDWDIYLCISSNAMNGGVLAGLDNSHVKVLKFNTTTANGWNWFQNLVYGWRLGMPQCINVVNFAIMSAIVMRYRNIYMYGIDHTFSAQLFVDDNNCVCSSERHVYATEPRIFRIPETTMSKILGNMSKAFAMHEQLEKYSKRVGVKIYNCTKGSFVDSYERKLEVENGKWKVESGRLKVKG